MIDSNVEKENFILRCFVKYIEENNIEGMEKLKSFVPILNNYQSLHSECLAKAIENGNAEEDYILIAWYDAIGPFNLTDRQIEVELENIRKSEIVMCTF